MRLYYTLFLNCTWRRLYIKLILVVQFFFICIFSKVDIIDIYSYLHIEKLTVNEFANSFISKVQLLDTRCLPYFYLLNFFTEKSVCAMCVCVCTGGFTRDLHCCQRLASKLVVMTQNPAHANVFN